MWARVGGTREYKVPGECIRRRLEKRRGKRKKYTRIRNLRLCRVRGRRWRICECVYAEVYLYDSRGKEGTGGRESFFQGTV